jgi:hypothetical protein
VKFEACAAVSIILMSMFIIAPSCNNDNDTCTPGTLDCQCDERCECRIGVDCFGGECKRVSCRALVAILETCEISEIDILRLFALEIEQSTVDIYELTDSECTDFMKGLYGYDTFGTYNPTETEYNCITNSLESIYGRRGFAPNLCGPESYDDAGFDDAGVDDAGVDDADCPGNTTEHCQIGFYPHFNGNSERCFIEASCSYSFYDREVVFCTSYCDIICDSCPEDMECVPYGSYNICAYTCSYPDRSSCPSVPGIQCSFGDICM